jgi:lysophospholipase L1-like esterase
MKIFSRYFIPAWLPAFLLPLFAWAQTPAPDLAVNSAATHQALAPSLPSLFIAGDSTAAEGSEGAIGWGRPFPDYFDATKINVVNLARGGRSSRTFITEGLWDQLLAQVKAGETVLIQFGHNDSGAPNEEPPGSTRPLRARGSLPGLGDEILEIDNVLTKTHEVVHTYGWYVRKMIADVKARGATPILLSLTIRNIWRDGHIERSSERYREWSRELARAAGIEFIDLSRLIADEYQRRGQAAVETFFPKDHTHTGAPGADLNAALVVAGLKGIKQGPFSGYLSAKGAAVEADRIGWLNLPEPANAALPTLLLIGDSTVRNGRGDDQGGQWGWGDLIGDHFDATKINVVNRAVGGLSSRTFRTQGHWDRARQFLKPGDYVMMQFGHNDSAPLNDDQRARGTINGTGDAVEAIDNILTKQHEVVHSYGWYLRHYVREARAAGAVPIVCSLVPRKTWKAGKIVRSGDDSYGGWARKIAHEEGVAFIDLNELIAARYDELGEEKVNALFADEHTHTSRDGAALNASIATAALRALPGDPLRAFARQTESK